MIKEVSSPITNLANGNTEAKNQYEDFVKKNSESGLRMIAGVMPCCGNEMLFLTPEPCETSLESSMFCVHCNSNVFKKVSFHNVHIIKIFVR